MPKERDSQRSKLYKAEKVLAQYSQRVETVPEMQAFLQKVLARKPIQDRYWLQIRKVIVVKDGRRCSNALGGVNWIKMPRWSRTQYIVLHEAAHSITQRKYGTNVAGHGWQYAEVYLDLVRFGLGAEAGAALKASFKAGKVRFSEPRAKRPATPEQLARLAAMREAARAAKEAGAGGGI